MALCLNPDKERLIKVWEDLLPERIDEWMGMAEYQNPDFRERVHETLARMRGLLAVALDADGQDD